MENVCVWMCVCKCVSSNLPHSRFALESETLILNKMTLKKGIKHTVANKWCVSYTCYVSHVNYLLFYVLRASTHSSLDPASTAALCK